MRLRLLTGDNIDGIGWILSDVLESMGFDIKRCKNSISAFEKELALWRPHGLVLFITNENSSLYPFIADISDRYPKLRIFVLTYVKSYSLMTELELLGVKDQFLMPNSIQLISRMILLELMPHDERTLMEEIIAYLEKKGTVGFGASFYCLCFAIMMCVYNPELLAKITTGLYPAVGDIMNMSASGVDQTLRRYSKSLYNMGMRFESYKGCHPMKNAALIGCAVDEFMEQYMKKHFPEQ